MFFWLIFLTSESDDYCKAYIKYEGSGAEFAYSYNDDDYKYTLKKQEMDSYIHSYPFILKIYVKYDYCTDYILVHEENISDSSKCEMKTIGNFLIPDKCNSGHYVNIVNDLSNEYNLTLIDRNNNSHIVRYSYQYVSDRTYFDRYFELFSTDVYIKSIYSDELCYVGKFESWPNNDFYEKNHSVDLSMVPIECLPYEINLRNNAPYFHKFVYESTFSEKREEIYYDYNSPIKYKDPFNITIYLVSGLSCNPENPYEIKTLEARKNISMINYITNDDVPSECKIENYPDDNVKYEPDHNNNSNIPYTFIYEGDCNKFNNIVQGCKNNTLDYSFCSFTNNAIDAFCYSDDVLENIDVNTEKIFIVLSSDDHYLKFKLKHHTVVHVKSTDYKDPEIYFQKYSDPPSKNLSVVIQGKKISYLTLTNINLTNRRFYNDDLNLHTLYVKSSFVLDSSAIKADHVINEYSDGVNYYSGNSQYTVVLKNQSSRPVYQIRFYDKEFSVYERNWYEDDYHAKMVTGEMYFRQNFMVGINFVSHFMDFQMNERISNAINDINLSIFSFDDELTSFNKPTLLEDQPKYYLNLTSSGEWWSAYSKKFTFTAHHDYLNIENHMNEKYTMIKDPVYEYTPVDGWAPKLYQPIDINDSSLKTYIIITDEEHISSCNYNMRRLLDCRYKESTDWYCNSNDKWTSYEINHIIDGKCIKSENINETLSSILPETDKVIIETDVDDLHFNFNVLPHQCVVQISSFKQLFSSKTLGRVPRSEDETKLIWKTISINGGIKSKVSYMTVSNSFLKITEEDLNIHTLKLIFSSLEYGYSINTNDLIVDFSSHVYLFDHQSSINVKQYGLNVPYDENASYYIDYGSDRWSLYTYTDSIYSKEPIDREYGYVPYKYADMVALIILSRKFTFGFNTVLNNDQIKDVNITLINEEMLHTDPDEISWFPINESKYNVSFDKNVIISSNPIPNVHVTAYHDLIYLDSKSGINVTKDDWVNYTTHPLITPSPSPAMTPMATMTPTATYLPTQTPTPEKVGNLYDEIQNEIKDPEKFVSDLKDKFDELKGDNVNSQENLVVVVNANSIPFQSNLNENQYIKPIPDAKIDFIKGNLNMVLPDKSSVTVSLKNSQDVKLKLKGSGTITFEQENKENNININEKANINGSLLINVPNDVKGIYVDSLDISNNGKIECKSTDDKNVPITVQSINAAPYSGIEMNNIIVKDTLTVAQTAQITLHDANLTNSKIIYNLVNFNDLDSIFKGEFNDPPESFDINLLDSSQSPTIDFNYLIVHGDFIGDCYSWKEKIKFGDSKIETNCQSYYYPYNNHAKLASEQYLTMKFIKDKDGGKGNGNDKNKPNSGVIAGIVIGVIAAIAIIVVVVIIVIKKKKGNNNSSTQENNEEAAENI